MWQCNWPQVFSSLRFHVISFQQFQMPSSNYFSVFMSCLTDRAISWSAFVPRPQRPIKQKISVLGCECVSACTGIATTEQLFICLLHSSSFCFIHADHLYDNQGQFNSVQIGAKCITVTAHSVQRLCVNAGLHTGMNQSMVDWRCLFSNKQ